MPKSTQSNKASSNGTKVPVKKVKKKLMDDEVMPGKKLQGDFSMNMALTVLALLMFAVGVFIYFFFFQSTSDVSTQTRPEIVIPEDSLPPNDNEVAGENEQPVEEPVEEEPKVEVLKVLILDTPTGFLNVRTGPGTGFAKIGTVSPGDSYDLVSENLEQTWYEVKLDGGTGWVIKTYAELE